MNVVVKNNGFGASARKVRAVCNLIRNKKASEAARLLRFCEKKEISLMLTKLLNSGLTIASESGKMDLDNVVISKIIANEGPTLKRVQPRAQGRAFRVRKRTSHITLELKEL
jgi:large subunit ribosomal protein L22